MTGADLKTARLSLHWTQQEAASRFGLTQAYLSMVEQGHRSVTPTPAAQVMKVLELPPTTLPLESDDSLSWNERNLKSWLGVLGYLARIIPFDLNLLLERYVTELRPYLGNPKREDPRLRSLTV